jgi:hypothetical protein
VEVHRISRRDGNRLASDEAPSGPLHWMTGQDPNFIGTMRRDAKLAQMLHHSDSAVKSRPNKRSPGDEAGATVLKCSVCLKNDPVVAERSDNTT